MLAIAQSFGSFGTYADEATSDSLGEDLPQRFDVGINYIDRGLDGSGNHDTPETAASRSNYFRETYAYGNEVKAPGIEPFLAHPALSQTAREISGCTNIVPAIVYANLLVPGQELAIHTDVPEFRGINRKTVPQWLLVVMLHSGLFDKWRVPILTCVSWFGSAGGGAFTFYPEGASGKRAAIPAEHNSAILIDTDKVFHGWNGLPGAYLICPLSASIPAYTSVVTTSGNCEKATRYWPTSIGRKCATPSPGRRIASLMIALRQYGAMAVMIYRSRKS